MFGKLCRNPLFIKSMSLTDVIGTIRDHLPCRNPLFIKSMSLTLLPETRKASNSFVAILYSSSLCLSRRQCSAHDRRPQVAILYSSSLCLSRRPQHDLPMSDKESQSFIHQVYVSHVELGIGPECGGHVAILYSSSLCLSHEQRSQKGKWSERSRNPLFIKSMSLT